MSGSKNPSAFIISGTGSSTGKTVVTLGIMEALRKRGVTVKPFKAGPDYIDPGHHSALLKRPSYNLDTWMMGKDAVKETFYGNISGTDVGIIEGVMGLFDGKDGLREEGSTAHLSKLLKIPVLLVINAERMAGSVAAMLSGFERFDPKVKIKWVVFNKVGSPRHFEILRNAVTGSSKVKVLGYLPKDEALSMPERHLGLITSEELKKGAWSAFLKKAGSSAEKFLDLDLLLEEIPSIKIKPEKKAAGPKRDLVRIAVARDEAFCFYYEENLEILKKYGAEVVFFSPLRDKKLPPDISGVYLGGGYPEFHCNTIESNIPMRADIKKRAEEGLPVYAECGGLMYLGRAIRDRAGKKFDMAGVFPWTSRMLPKRKALGYREAVLNESSPFGKGTVRGHEYHYSEITEPPSKIKRAYGLKDRETGKDISEGYLYKNTLASYIHLHFASNPSFAKGFVEACRKFLKSR